MASGPLPRETLDRIMALDALALRGNADRELLERGGRGLSDDWVASQLEPRHEEWLRSLPETIEPPAASACPTARRAPTGCS